MVEYLPSKQAVASSSLVFRSIYKIVKRRLSSELWERFLLK